MPLNSVCFILNIFIAVSVLNTTGALQMRNPPRRALRSENHGYHIEMSFQTQVIKTGHFEGYKILLTQQRSLVSHTALHSEGLTPLKANRLKGLGHRDESF